MTRVDNAKYKKLDTPIQQRDHLISILMTNNKHLY